MTPFLQELHVPAGCRPHGPSLYREPLRVPTGVTRSALLLRAHAPDLAPLSRLHYARRCSLCRLLRAPAGTRSFPTLSLRILPDVPGPLPPAARGVHLPVSSPTTSAFPPLGQGRRQQDPCSDFSTVAISGLQSFSYVQARRFAGHPGRSYRCAIAQGSRDFLRPSLSWFVTSPRPGYACRPNRATDGRGLSPHKMRSLVGCSPNDSDHRACADDRATCFRADRTLRCIA